MYNSHVQRRRETLLSIAKYIYNPSISNKGKLASKRANEVTVYYLIIRRSTNTFVDTMENAIRSTYFHKISAAEKAQYENYPSDEGT